ncbi:MAG: succinate-semialdehyde dehydrogenase, partial [Chloroflexota bacterium]
MAIQSLNPATEAVLATFAEHSWEEVERALSEADTAFRRWREAGFAERAALMRRTAALLRERKARYAGLITAEMGKPIVEAEAEVEKCAWNCDYYAEHAARFLADEPIVTNATESCVVFDPLGVILAVMPWNFPFWQVFRFAAPALMAGNTCVLKHASNVPQCALAIEEVFRDAGFPSGCFRTLLISGATAERVIAHPLVRAVTLTGSDSTGERV